MPLSLAGRIRLGLDHARARSAALTPAARSWLTTCRYPALDSLRQQVLPGSLGPVDVRAPGQPGDRRFVQYVALGLSLPHEQIGARPNRRNLCVGDPFAAWAGSGQLSGFCSPSSSHIARLPLRSTLRASTSSLVGSRGPLRRFPNRLRQVLVLVLAIVRRVDDRLCHVAFCKHPCTDTDGPGSA